jgi:hypothetical protein
VSKIKRGISAFDPLNGDARFSLHGPFFEPTFDQHGRRHFVEVEDFDDDLSRHDPPWTKKDHPYNYDPFTIWGGPSKEHNGTDYTDRLDEWDPAKYTRLAAKHYQSGTSSYERPFDSYNCKSHLIQAFLRDWHDDPKLRLTRVVEYCHPHTGYQTWRLDYVCTKEGYPCRT